MKCPKCGETLKDDAKVCFTCGENVGNNDIENIIDNMIKEDEAASIKETSKPKDTKSKNTNNKEAKNKLFKRKPKIGTQKSGAQKSNGKENSKTLKSTKMADTGKKEFGNGVRITRYVTAGVIGLFLLTMLFDWFGFGGRGVYLGFELDQNSGQFMTSEAVEMSDAKLKALGPDQEILQYSPKDLLDYIDLYSDEYTIMENTKGVERTVWAVVIQTIYIRGFYLVLIAGLLSILLTLIDKNLKTVEWSRGFSVLSIVIIGLNYAALKIPFFSMFTIKARNILRTEHLLSSVTMNMNGVNVNNDFYPYHMIEKTGFFIAIGACVLWFVLTTVLVEMKKDKEFS